MRRPARRSLCCVIGFASMLLSCLVVAGCGPVGSTPTAADESAGVKSRSSRSDDRRMENSIGMPLVLIPAGEFTMGSPLTEKGRTFYEVQHAVTISKPFYMGVYEVKQQEYENITGRNPSYHSKAGNGKRSVEDLDTSRFPVEQITWFDAVEFCNLLSEREQAAVFYKMSDVKRDDSGSITQATVTFAGGNGYRLPTEAEWEYACRAGTTTPFSFGSVLNGEQANADGNHPYATATKGPALGRTARVGSYKPNRFGLCDMHGNVWEWCWDYFEPGRNYERLPVRDPVGAPQGSERVNRGGSWFFLTSFCRSASRNKNRPSDRIQTLGFRVARSQ